MTSVEDKLTSVNSDSPPKISDETNSPERDNSSTKNERETISPDLSCAICLCKLENKSFTDSCFHQFCFTCLLEWSKVKAECPLCKQAFKSIIHNVRSIEDYDQYHLRPDPPRPTDLLDGRRFRYRSTMTAERRHTLALREMIMRDVTRPSPSFSPWDRDRNRMAMTSDIRKEIYRKGIRVRPIEHAGVTRIRDVSPAFFRDNPACTHRLLPWLNRELVVLLENHESRISFVMELILSLIQRFAIQSQEFAEHIRPYIQYRTDHFIHEFFNFARSPWDIYSYDQNSVYPETNWSSTNPSPDSDVMVLTPQTETGSSTRNNNVAKSQPNNLWNSVIAMPTTSSSDSSSPTQNVQFPSTESTLQKVKKFLRSLSSDPDWPSPTVSNFSWNSPSSSTLPILKTDANLEDPVPITSPQPGPSGVRSVRGLYDDSSDVSSVDAVPRFNAQTLDSSSDNDCVILEVEKPTGARTPLVIDLVSDSDHEHSQLSRLKVADRRHSTSSSSTSPEPKPRYKSVIGSYKTSSVSSSCSGSHRRWRWTAQEYGGTLQRSYSKSTSTSRSRSNSCQRFSSSSPSRHHSKKKSKKHHKKHKRKHHHHKHRDEISQHHKCKKHYMGHKSSRRES